MRQCSHLVGQQGLGLVQGRTTLAREFGDPFQREFSKQGQKARYIPIVAITPELPEVEARQATLVKPYCAVERLAHFFAITIGQQWHGQTEQLTLITAPGQFDAVDDVGPLVGTAQLQGAVVQASQLGKVMGLQQGITELQK
ncbi:hypothetical protein D3C76_1059480 [compost metagenome]